MKQAMYTTSRPRVSAWHSVVAGFLVGFLIVFGWQSGTYQENSRQTSAAN
jgi:predicted negative regulator of RcsB-dependent stress response